MVDLLVAWGVAQAVGFIFKPILEDLAKDSAKDFAKDFLKDSLKHVLLPDKEPLNIAIGKAIKEFLQLVQQQLEVADLSEAEQKQYTEPLKQFLKNKSVKEVLGSAFKDDCQGLDTKKLAKIWSELNLLPLPDEFSWKQVNKPYLNKVKAIIRESPQLRAILDSQKLTIEQLKTEVFGKHWQDETWHEVLRLIAGMIDARFTGEIIEYLIQINGETEKFINVFLAAKCLFEVRNRSGIAAATTQLLNRLKNLRKYDLPFLYYYEPYGDEASVVREIRTQAVAAIATTWKDDPDTLAWLKQRAQFDDNEDVRYAALQELARGWKDEP